MSMSFVTRYMLRYYYYTSFAVFVLWQFLVSNLFCFGLAVFFSAACFRTKGGKHVYRMQETHIIFIYFYCVFDVGGLFGLYRLSPSRPP